MGARSIAPRGREAVMAAVQAAAVDLLAERGPRDMTVREVAGRAGVNHALVHRHFGTKDALIRTVVAEQSRELATRAAALPRPDETAVLALLSEHAAYWRVLARIVLDAPAMLADLELPAAAATLGLVTGGAAADEETRVGAAVAASTTLGWLVFGPHLATVLGLTEPSAYDERIGQAVRAAVSRPRSR
ncbi:MAG: TetR/AcrR family transcriptional regulator [Jatrophihabitans sp.]|uniref:TetR/AcrR family transcriptional regulator n=1 Tax=Jatrophihabitans sp. TaxID=1932789 RepID=UPI00390E5DAB